MKTKCMNCGRTFDVPAQYDNRGIKCPACHAVGTVDSRLVKTCDGAKAKESHKAKSSGSRWGDFFSFRLMVYPAMVKLSFLLLTILFLVGAALAIVWALAEPTTDDMSRREMVESAAAFIAGAAGGKPRYC